MKDRVILTTMEMAVYPIITVMAAEVGVTMIIVVMMVANLMYALAQTVQI